MKTLYIAVAIALVFAGSAYAANASQNTAYVTAGPSVTGIWCKAGGHNYVPIGDASDYGDTTDPAGDPIGFVETHESWAWSGEPECLAGDTAFGKEDDHAWFAAAFCIGGTLNGDACGDHRTHILNVESNDLIGTPNLYVAAYECPDAVPNCDDRTEGRVLIAQQGCGGVSMTLPTNPPRHWQSTLAEPTFLVWMYVDGSFLDESSGLPCIGTAGTVSASF